MKFLKPLYENRWKKICFSISYFNWEIYTCISQKLKKSILKNISEFNYKQLNGILNNSI